MKNLRKREVLAISVLTAFSLLIICTIASCGNKATEEAEPISVWDQTDWTEVGGFEMEGNNTTYMKEVGIDAKSVDIRIDHFTSPEPVYFRLLIREEFEDHFGILAEQIIVPATASADNFILTAPVKKGTKLRIETQVYNADGIYIPDLTCDLSYSYKLN